MGIYGNYAIKFLQYSNLNEVPYQQPSCPSQWPRHPPGHLEIPLLASRLQGVRFRLKDYGLGFRAF